MVKPVVQILACKDFLELAESAEYDVVGVDTETNDADCRDGRGFAIGLSLAIRLSENLYAATYFPFRHALGNNVSQEMQHRVRALFQRWLVDGITVAIHNAKFDLVSLPTLGINWTGKFYCTLQMAHLINENFPMDKSLNSCVHVYIDKEESKKDEALKKWTNVGWGMVPSEVMFEYGAYDAYLHLRLYYALIDRFKNEVSDWYWETRQEFTRTMIKMESRGVRVDVDLCNKMAAVGEDVLRDITAEIGGNIGSPVFLKKLLIDDLGLPVVKTSPRTGKPSFDKFAMEEYDEMLERIQNPTADYIRTYRGWQKSVSSNYAPYVNLLSPDGRLRPNYKLHGTKTGRMSCSLPNLQQIPRVSDKPWNGVMKSCFIPEDGYVLIEADYSQLELRLATAYANETSLKILFAEGRDVFTEMAEEIGMPRHNVKTMVYTIQYGGGIKRLSNVFGISAEEAAARRESFYSRYPGFRNATNAASSKCIQNKRVSLWNTNRYRHFMYPKDEAHKAFNSIIQGGAADIVSIVMNRLMREVDDDEKCRMLLQVHDSVVFEIRQDVLEEYKKKIVDIMSDVQPDFGVVFAVDAHEWGH